MSRPSVEVETAVAGEGASAPAADEGASAVAAEGDASPPSAEDDASAASAVGAACANCEELLAGDYCHRCGEKRPEARDLSVRHFAGEAARELTSLDSTLKTPLRLNVKISLFTIGYLRNGSL